MGGVPDLSGPGLFLAEATENMHISVYVPDRLWESARAAYPGEGTSALARRAVTSLVEAASPAGPLKPPAACDRLAGAVIGRMAADARRWSELGYDAGLHLAQTLEWWVVEQVANVAWAVADMPFLTSWPIIRDELRTYLQAQVAGIATFACGLIAELDHAKPNLRRYSAFGLGMRRAFASASCDDGRAGLCP